MVVKIRLARWGARNNPFYGIVIANQRAPRDGKHLERVGTYNPIPDQSKAKIVELNIKRIKYWLSVGAQPTDRVAFILAKVFKLNSGQFDSANS
jgi:small subunit ribosomal protein S16